MIDSLGSASSQRVPTFPRVPALFKVLRSKLQILNLRSTSAEFPLRREEEVRSPWRRTPGCSCGRSLLGSGLTLQRGADPLDSQVGGSPGRGGGRRRGELSARSWDLREGEDHLVGVVALQEAGLGEGQMELSEGHVIVWTSSSPSGTHLHQEAAVLLRSSEQAGQLGLVVPAGRGAGRLVVVRETHPPSFGGGAWRRMEEQTV